jgi:hypothetical protein
MEGEPTDDCPEHDPREDAAAAAQNVAACAACRGGDDHLSTPVRGKPGRAGQSVEGEGSGPRHAGSATIPERRRCRSTSTRARSAANVAQ